MIQRSAVRCVKSHDVFVVFAAVVIGCGDLTANLAAAQASKTTATQATNTAPKAPPAGDQVVKIPADQLDSLVAPIALYPDVLLAQVLAASTYPLEIVQLQQWLAKNPGLKDKALTDAVVKQPWDPSVQSTAALPDVVKRLADDIQWTTDLGNAFLAQQKDVMDAVQRMRKKAQEKGRTQVKRAAKGRDPDRPAGQQVIVIEQANPQVVYVPSYDPVVVYGAPIYPVSADLLPVLPGGRCVRHVWHRIGDGRVDQRRLGLWLRMGRRQRLHQPQQ